MDKVLKRYNDKIPICDDLVINKSYFLPLSNDLTCQICQGLLDNPILCANCEIPFCSQCIDQWTKKNNQCVMKCEGIFQPKKIQRMIKNMMENVLLECKICKKTINLVEYPNHIITCQENTIKMNCPCCDGITTKGELRNKVKSGSIEKAINKLNEDFPDFKILKLEENSQKTIESKDTIIIDSVSYLLCKNNCKHFPKSYSAYAYSCCNKTYGCSDCHLEKETHERKFADKGYCLICKFIFHGKLDDHNKICKLSNNLYLQISFREFLFPSDSLNIHMFYYNMNKHMHYNSLKNVYNNSYIISKKLSLL